MRKYLRFGSLLGMVMFIMGCSSRFAIPEKPIHMTVSTLCNQSYKLVGLIAEGHYERLYQEAFSDSLQQAVPFREFQSRLESFTEDYGPLKLRFSGMQSCQQIESTRYMVSFALQYKSRTIFTEFLFEETGSGEDPEVLLAGYRFVDE
ncbi:MAG TPA: hypothetical protein VKA68_15950 [bacterium]|nr:hypothetical protein [bacterium]